MNVEHRTVLCIKSLQTYIYFNKKLSACFVFASSASTCAFFNVFKQC